MQNPITAVAGYFRIHCNRAGLLTGWRNERGRRTPPKTESRYVQDVPASDRQPYCVSRKGLFYKWCAAVIPVDAVIVGAKKVSEELVIKRGARLQLLLLTLRSRSIAMSWKSFASYSTVEICIIKFCYIAYSTRFTNFVRPFRTSAYMVTFSLNQTPPFFCQDSFSMKFPAKSLTTVQ